MLDWPAAEGTRFDPSSVLDRTASFLVVLPLPVRPDDFADERVEEFASEEETTDKVLRCCMADNVFTSSFFFYVP